MLAAALTPTEFQRLTGTDDDVMARLATFVVLLEKWNGRVNLVARAGLRDVWRRHLLDSLQLAPLVPDEGHWLDVGSGAGFPGLIVAMAGRANVHLVESDGRKATFLREAARLTGTEVTVHSRRIERLPAQQANVISARALAPLPRLLPLLYPHLADNGTCLLLKGQDVEEELTAAAKSWSMQVEKIQSRSDPRGIVLKLTEVSDDRPDAAKYGQG